MPISNKALRAMSICACGLAFPLHADDLTFADGASRLTGSVRSIDGEGRVELASPLSPEPLLLKGGSVEKVDFSAGGTSPEPPPALIELINGDVLPGAVSGLDERNLTIITPEAGRLDIPRDRIASMQFGIHRRKVVYSGPKGLKEWLDEDAEAKNWSFKNHGLIASGSAIASKKLALPRQFILRFTLKWQAKKSPNFQVHFADPLKAKGEACDRYYVQFGGAGLEIKREAAEGKRYNTIVQLNRTPNEYPDRQVKMEIRVNRDASRLHLFIDGEPEGEFADPISPVPAGSGITLVCNTPSDSSQEIRDIEVLEFDDSRARHHAEERGDSKVDSLISREEDRWSGRLLGIRKSGEGAVFRFQSDFQNEALEIPEADVSTVFLASKDGAAADGRKAPFVLTLCGEGVLRVSSCRFTEDTVSAVHPLLGPLDLRRDGIVSMERTSPKPEPASEP